MDVCKTNELAIISGQPTCIDYCNIKQMGQIMDFCKLIASSDIAPKEYKVGKGRNLETAAANVFLALETAIRTKHSIFEIMQNMKPVSGQPTWRSSYLAAEINSCGRYDKLRYKEWIDEEVKTVDIRVCISEGNWQTYTVPNYCCYAYTRDRKTGEELCSQIISVSMAAFEGWTKSTKWVSMPQQMLIYRATSFFSRRHCPEITQGIYASDEIEDVFGQETSVPAQIERPKIDAESLSTGSQFDIQKQPNQSPSTSDSQSVIEQPKTEVEGNEDCGY